MEVPPSVLVRLHLLAGRGFAHGVSRAEQAGRGEPLDALHAEVHSIRLKLEREVHVLDQRRRRREGGAKLFAREDAHPSAMLGRG